VDVVFLVPIAWIVPVWVPFLTSAAALALALRLRAGVPHPSLAHGAHPKIETRR